MEQVYNAGRRAKLEAQGHLYEAKHRIVHLESDVSRFRWQRDLAIRATQDTQARARHAYALQSRPDTILAQLAERTREWNEANLVIYELRNDRNELNSPLEALELELEKTKRGARGLN